MPDPSDLAATIRACNDADYLTELGELLATVDTDAVRAGAVCLGGGTCCRFDRMGHRLYASTGELALLASEPFDGAAALEMGRCPYQVGVRCTARKRRPLGCRVFFCDVSLRSWCAQSYEQHHAAIRRLHERFALPYLYVDAIAGLAALDQAAKLIDRRRRDDVA